MERKPRAAKEKAIAKVKGTAPKEVEAPKKRKRAAKEEKKQPVRRSVREGKGKAPSRFADGDEKPISNREKEAKRIKLAEKEKKVAEKEKAKKAEESKAKKDDGVEEEAEEEEEVETKAAEKKEETPKGEPKKKAAPAKKETPAEEPKKKVPPPVKGLKGKKKDDDEDDGDEEQEAEEHADEEDDNNEDDIDKEALAEHLAGVNKPNKAAENFVAGSEVFQWESAKSGKKYVIRAKVWVKERGVKDPYDYEELEFDWPRSFVGNESQPVMAAVWERDTSRLAAVWTFSLAGDETNIFYIKAFEADIWDLLEIMQDDGATILGDKEKVTTDSFSVSSGDQAVPKLYCPSLENLSL